MTRPLKSLIVSNRRRTPFAAASRFAARFMNAYYNTGEYDFDSNGEPFALRAFGRVAPVDPVAWDVGAHHGEYAQAIRQFLPQSRIAAFEILPPIAERLRHHLRSIQCDVLNMGLSDQVGEVDVVWNKRSDTTNSIAPLKESAFFDHDNLETVSCPVSTVDQLISEGRPAPHFLKIDVEGHEAAVLRGARTLLAGPDAPIMIQFEYGHTWIAAGEMLYHTQLRLEEAGYRVGRLFPDYVDFKPFHWRDEHFRMGNYIAVRSQELIDLLS